MLKHAQSYMYLQCMLLMLNGKEKEINIESQKNKTFTLRKELRNHKHAYVLETSH